MKDKDKTKEQLINELVEMHQRIAELEASETERKRAEEALWEKEAHLQAVFKAAGNISFVTMDLTGTEPHILDFSPGAERIFGYSREEVIGKPVAMLHLPEDMARFREVLEAMRQRKSGFTGESTLVRKSGEEFPTLFTTYPIFDAEGNMTATLSVSIDITERRRAEDALRESEARYRAVVEDQTELICRFLQDGTLTFVNEAYCRYFGKKREELIGSSVMPLIPEEDRKLVKMQFVSLSWENPVATYEHRVVAADGEIRWMQWTDRAIFGEQGRLIEFQSVGRDITERKRAEKALRLRAEELAALQATVLDVTAPHDLPTLLQTIVERAALLLNALGGGLYLCDPDQEEARCVVSYNTPHDYSGTVLKYGEGAAGIVAQTGEPLIIDDYRTWSKRAAVYEEEQPFTAVLSAPMIWQGQVTGVIHVLHNVESRRFARADLELLTLFANHAAIAVENARLYEQAQKEITERRRAEEVLRQRNRELALLNRASQTFSSTLDPDQVLVTVLEEVRRLLDVVACSIWLTDSETEELVCRQATGPQSEIVRGWRLTPGEGLAGWVAHHGESLIVPDTRADERHFKDVDQQTGLGLRSILSVPLRVKKGVIGVLQVVDTEVGRFSPTDLTLLEPLATTAAIAIENARLYKQARQDAETRAVLLREVNHRVKNNLTAIIGLLYTERRRAGMEDQAVYQSIMQDLVNRVQGLATVHSLLSASGWTPLLLSEVTAQVIRSSLQVLPRDRVVSVEVTPSPVRVTPDQAHDLALVINELATNTVKHALQERDTGHITVRIVLEDDTVLFEFRDDGPGYPEEVLQLERQDVGLDLVQNVVRKGLRGELSLHNDHGAVAVIQFKAKA